ncbi:hypothetical protein AMJ47_01210 [Parcubacteria bacterium DG_72]|nr:MAG: hypothetical protein AMJ47_01210 [Parcubacteria bacterium DG_72]
MKIYFAGSIRGGRLDQENYFKIIKHLQNYGEVLNEHVGKADVFSFEKNFSDEEIYKRDLSWLKEADVVIAEISVPSLGVGYEIAKAEELNKKILCIYKKQENNNKISAMINGNESIKVLGYRDLTEAFKYIDNFLKK